MTYILGLNVFRSDSAACLLRSGRLVAAVEEERFRRIKHWAGFPREAIRYCLAAAGIALADVEQVAVGVDAAAGDDAFGLLESHLTAEIPGSLFAGTMHGVTQRLAQLASAFLMSPFDEAVVVSVGGAVRSTTTAWGVGRGTHIVLEGGQGFPHSLGLFYRALTQFIGFHQLGDEYKVMGLAPYGRPAFLPEMRRIVQTRQDGSFTLNPVYFRLPADALDPSSARRSAADPLLYSAELEALLGPARGPGEPLTQRHKDIAHSAQAMYEEALFQLLDALHARHGLGAVAVAGDGGLNSVANGRLCLRTPFRRVFVPPAPGDAGTAIGAAMAVWHGTGGAAAQVRAPTLAHANWGPAFADEDIARVLQSAVGRIDAAVCEVGHIEDVEALCRQTAADIADGKVVGWFQGRMEWGPRALGNRSIVCDPRRADMKDILNMKIKRRESFRPFAPSVLRADVGAWFEQDDDVPFMTQVVRIRPERRERIPAVTHVDGSGRLQTVDEHANPLYHRLISAFRDRTGVPMVLNTSFNENEPIVCRPEEALDCFLRTEMDVLVLGGWVIRRRAQT